MKSFAGFAGFMGTMQIDWQVALSISAAAVLGSVGGSWLAQRVHPASLRTIFGWFVVAMAFFILGQEVPPMFDRTASPLWSALGALSGTFILALIRNAVSGAGRQDADLSGPHDQPTPAARHT